MAVSQGSVIFGFCMLLYGFRIGPEWYGTRGMERGSKRVSTSSTWPSPYCSSSWIPSSISTLLSRRSPQIWNAAGDISRTSQSCFTLALGSSGCFIARRIRKSIACEQRRMLPKKRGLFFEVTSLEATVPVDEVSFLQSSFKYRPWYNRSISRATDPGDNVRLDGGRMAILDWSTLYTWACVGEYMTLMYRFYRRRSNGQMDQASALFEIWRFWIAPKS